MKSASSAHEQGRDEHDDDEISAARHVVSRSGVEPSRVRSVGLLVRDVTSDVVDGLSRA